ncbi:CobW family GTP-binding protein [Brevibacillus invocatus]|uniref:CobW family GTP-binding protein n=1 Tax=Brevibacillus invocatus TaxID=173959 RepID=UPI00203BBDE4|nr:GTP-binding protein [Brevibacillus invocatus]MCM3080138.1 GTP-binding protein [Brevibacillus invocatus]MCM3430415.1 GTP-binding protein [Brevibacillus invocatus]
MSTHVYLLTGYLGSGKTTLLHNLLGSLREQDGEVVVLMNEMGEEDIDGEQLQGFGFPVKKMLDGCICCSIRGELTEGLKEILASLKPDKILIETTGVADPIDVIDGLTHPELYDRLDLKGTISVIDASRFLDLNSRFQSTGSLVKTIRNQVRYADLLLVNKTDLTTPDVLQKVQAKLRELNPHAPLYETIRSEVDLNLLLSVKRITPPEREEQPQTVSVQKSIGRLSPMDKIKQSLGIKTSQPSLYNSIETFAYPFTAPVDGEKFEDFLYDLPKNVYRVKGYVLFHGKKELISFQHTDNQVLMFPFENFGPKMVAVFIGEGMDQEKIKQDLEKCYEE